MRLLDRYLLRELLVPLFYCTIGFYVFWNTYDVVGELRMFQRQKLTAIDIANYYAIKVPEFLVLVIPLAFLLAMLYALTSHARYNEITAMRAAGMSVWRIALPYLGAGFVLSVLVGVLNETWVPQSSDAAEQILNRYVASKHSLKEWERRLGFTNFRDRRQWFIQAYNLHREEMMQPHVFWKSPDGTRHEVSAEGAGYDGVWWFTNAQELIYPPGPAADPVRVQSDLRPMHELNETPRQIKAQIKISKLDSFRTASKTQLSIKEILDFKRWNPGRSPRAAMLDTKMHGRIAMAWTCLVVVLIALPFGFVSGRRNVFAGVASSVLICFGFFVLQQLGLALGSGGYLPPILAAWLPNLIFAGLGICMLWRVR